MKKAVPFIVRVFNYFEPLWTGRDGRISLRNLAAIVLIWKMIENFDYAVQKWDSGRNIGDIVGGLWVFAVLIGALLGISVYQNIQTDKIEAELNAAPAPPSITVQKADNVTGGQNIASAENVNADSVQNQNIGAAKQVTGQKKTKRHSDQ